MLPMKILPKYIIKEHLPPFLFALAVLMFIFLMQFLLKYITKIFGKGLPFFTIIELVFYNLAWMFALAVPMAVLVATLMSFGRLSGDNEITILKSSGISIYKIIRPALIFGGVITILMTVFNDKVLPDFNHRARVMFQNIGQKKATLKLEPGIFFDLGKYSFYVEKIEKTLGEELSERTNLLGPEIDPENSPDKLKTVTIFDRSYPNKTITVTADEGYMVYSTTTKSLVFTLFDGEYHEFDNRNTEDYRFSHFERNRVNIPAPEYAFENRDDDYRGDREMDVSMMIDKVEGNEESMHKEAAKIKERVDTIWKTLTKELPKEVSNAGIINNKTEIFEDVPEEILNKAIDRAYLKVSRLQQLLKSSGTRITSHEVAKNRYLVEVHKKFSIPFASIVFILVGAPLGIASRKGSMGIGITLSIFFFLLYWICLILGEDLADRRFLHPMLAMWFPNILIGFSGLYLTLRTVKETTVTRWDIIGKLITKIRVKNRKRQDDAD
jgi:lipopolysaccharide export system permease protein